MSQPAINVQYANINTSTIGNNTIIPSQKDPAGVGKSIKVWGAFITSAAAQNLNLIDGATTFTGSMAVLANLSGIVYLPIGTMPWWVLSPGNALVLSLGSGSQTSGIIVWSL